MHFSERWLPSCFAFPNPKFPFNVRLQNLLGDQIGIYLNILTLSSFVALGRHCWAHLTIGLSDEIFVQLYDPLWFLLRRGKKWMIGDKENQIENGYFQEIISTNRTDQFVGKILWSKQRHKINCLKKDFIFCRNFSHSLDIRLDSCYLRCQWIKFYMTATATRLTSGAHSAVWKQDWVAWTWSRQSKHCGHTVETLLIVNQGDIEPL